MSGSKLARAAVVCYLGLSGSALAQGVLPPIIPGGTGTVQNVTINAGTNITLSGACTGTLTITCTINATSGAGITAGTGLTLTGTVMSLGDSNLTYTSAGQLYLGGTSYTGFGTLPVGISTQSNNANVLANAGDNTSGSVVCNVSAYDNPNLTPGFTDANCQQTFFRSINVDSLFSATTQAKTTTTENLQQNVFLGAGQKISSSITQYCFGMSDCSFTSGQLYFAGGPIAGDEGTGFALVTQLSQFTNLVLSTIMSVPAQSTCNTTITAAITTLSAAPQTVPVVSSTGCNAGDWVIIGQDLPANGQDNKFAAQLTAAGSNTITAVFRGKALINSTVTPAMVLMFNSTFQSGQNRVMVNLTRPSYTTGTVASINTNKTFTGAGTTWATNMVGGNTTNIGCIALAADTYSGSPFNGTVGTSGGPLKSYYQIQAINSTTSLDIYSFQLVGGGVYVGKGPGAGTYEIHPCAEIMYMGNTPGSGVTGLMVLESSALLWQVGDIVETAFSPYPAVNGFQYKLSEWMPGGTYQTFLDVENNGIQWQNGFTFGTNGQPAGTLTTPAWDVVGVLNSANIGLRIGPDIRTAAIQMFATDVSGACSTDACGMIEWGAAANYIKPNSSNGGFDYQMAAGATGLLQFISAGGTGGEIPGSVDEMLWAGILGLKATALSNLAPCNTAMQDSIAATLSGTTTYGATVTAGSNRIIAHCNGTNWTVMGI